LLSAMLGVHESESPSSNTSAAVYVVRNTFVELIDEANSELRAEEQCVPPFRRRRGSSFFRSSSEPLTANGRGDSCWPVPCDVTSTDDEGSDHGLSTPEVSPASSRVASPAPGSRSPMYANLSQLPSLESRSTAMAAAMHAGFNSGLWAAMSPQTHVPQVSFCPQGTKMRQMPLFFEARNTSFTFSQAEQMRPLTRETSPHGQHSSNSSDDGTVASGMKPAHLIWCDHRAFKETSSILKDQLENAAGVTVKTHKTAENCIRLFRKKQRAQGRPPCVILVSWANSMPLLQYLAEAQHVTAKVVVLCDARSCRKTESVDQLSVDFPFVEKIATTWEAAVEAASNAVSALH